MRNNPDAPQEATPQPESASDAKETAPVNQAPPDAVPAQERATTAAKEGATAQQRAAAEAAAAREELEQWYQSEFKTDANKGMQNTAEAGEPLNKLTENEMGSGIRSGLKSPDTGKDLGAIDAENAAAEQARRVEAEVGLDETVNEIIANQERQREEQNRLRGIADQIAANKAEETEIPDQEAQPDQGKNFARRAGEITGRVARAAMRGGKAAVETYRRAEAERLEAERASPDKSKSPARIIAETVIKGGMRGLEALKAYRAARAERKTNEAEQRRSAEAAKSQQSAKGPERTASKAREKADSQLDLNDLQKQIEFLRDEIKNLRGQGPKAEGFNEIRGLNSELAELLAERGRLAEKVTGRSTVEIMADAEKRVAKTFGYSTREDYVRALLPIEQNRATIAKETALLNQEWESLSKRQQKKYGHPEIFRAKMLAQGRKMGLSEDEYFGLLNAGYKPVKKKGFFNIGRSFVNTLALPFNILRFSRGNFGRSERKVVLPNGKKAWMRTKDFKEMARLEGEKNKNRITDEARNQLGERWGAEVRRQTEESLERTANDLNGAIERTRESYRQEKIRMLSEFITSLGERQLTPAQQKQRDKMFGQKPKAGRGATPVFDQLASGTGRFDGTNGDVSKNSRIFGREFDEFGLGSGAIRNIAGAGGAERKKSDIWEALRQELLKVIDKFAKDKI